MPHGIYPPAHAAMNVERAGEKYRPSNGTEGDIFCSSFCGKCRRNEAQGPVGCEIRFSTMVLDTRDPEYPSEWQYGKDGQPTCTAFEPYNAVSSPPSERNR